MEVEASRKMVLMVMAVLMFSTFVTEINAKDAAACVKECANLCSGTANPIFCNLICTRRCGGSHGLVPPELGHCKLGCLTSTCFDQHSGILVPNY
ncbi:hypothetical protein NL676_021308 [Syzygium grande]|nr:hypothetical protein NL676_039273 [Syzygium grande]KAI6693598.1 hypothetical protein NL676_021308 [Syzygium grande]